MPVKPYTIIEIFRSKGFDTKEAEEIVDFISESSQEKVLEAIQPLATSAEVKELDNKINILKTELTNKIDTVKTELTDKIDTVRTELTDKIEIRTRDVELRLIKWIITTGIASVGILIAAMKYILQ